MSSATFAGRVGTGQGGNSGPGGYCPPVVIESNSFAAVTVPTVGTLSGVLDGFNLDQITEVRVELTTNAAIVGVVTNLNVTFLQAGFTIDVPQAGVYDVLLVGTCGTFTFEITAANITCLIPDQNGVVWQGLQNVVTGAGSIAAISSTGNGWNRGGYFGFAPANTPASAKFIVAAPVSAPNGEFGFIGVRNNPQTNITFGSAGRAIYLQNGSAIVYNNTQFQQNIGGYTVGDEFEFSRNQAGNMEILKNGTSVFTYPTPDAGTWYMCASIFRNTSVEGLELCHS